MGHNRKQLTPKELKFVLAYTEIGTVTCGRQGKAALAAGWPEAEADKQAARLMKAPRIREAIQASHEKMMNKAMINPSKILADLENTKHLALAKGDLTSANRAIHLQGQYLTMFGDKYLIADDEQAIELTHERKIEAEVLAEIRLRFGDRIREEVERRLRHESPVPFSDEDILSGKGDV